MPSPLLHATVVELLAEAPGDLPPELGRALAEDLEYARFGALLADLPNFDGMAGALAVLRFSPPTSLARELHERAPVTFGLKMAELVANGALVGTEPGLAVLGGYFTHLCLERLMHPVVERLVERHRLREESPCTAHQRIEWIQALYFLRDIHGSTLVGRGKIRERLRIQKRAVPTSGLGRGLYELLRLSSEEALGKAPPKPEVDRWLRGLYAHGWLLSSPLGRARATPLLSPIARRELYSGPEVDVPGTVELALTMSRRVLQGVFLFLQKGRFNPRARGRFQAEFLAESAQGSCAA